MRTAPSARATKATLWVTLVALLLVTMTSGAELRTCLGMCHAAADAATTTSCCAVSDAEDGSALDSPASCCGCCDHDGEDEDLGGGGADAPAGGCCVTIAFDVELAPSGAAAEVCLDAPAAVWTELCAPPNARVAEAARPSHYDRGPPRVDGRTALRATLVLLI
jgi:hypothetical protein